ncbi:hypothetical protein LPJ53_006086 [Coemansia erecta]|uniref:Uncharacterized protein n=1 Tax=Coemansia erecta TaxID=147472 RepID=A0A9W7XR27_9FUNG|nr:hypothetical protein LPJ53_006086 [Coemansia erecta]
MVFALAVPAVAAPADNASDAAVMPEAGSEAGPAQEYDGSYPEDNYKRAYENVPAGHHLVRRGGWGCGNCGGWGCGGCGRWGFPFAANTANRFNNNAYAANYHDNTQFCNNKNAHVAANNVNSCNSANIIG